MEFPPYLNDEADLAKRVGQIRENLPAGSMLNDSYRTIYQCIDLTTLEGTDNASKIQTLCQKALAQQHHPAIGKVAAVCVYMPFVAQAKELLRDSGVEVATVSCGFPAGQLPLHLKLAETGWAAEQGTDEIDMVISRGTLLQGDEKTLFNEIKAVKAACGNARLKVILETGELKDLAVIRKACELALSAGADFLKTSTGKVSPAATPEAVLVMLDTIRDFYQATGKKVGIKPAGGIAEPQDALLYYALVDNVLGKEWLTPSLFRIGASRLADKLVGLLSA